MLGLRFTGIISVISELGLRDNFAKELKDNDYSWSFSYYSFVKFHGEKIWETHDCVMFV